MKFSPKQYAQALFDAISHTQSKDHDRVLDNFVQILAANNDLRMFDLISEEFENVRLKSEGKIKATVSSARKMDEATNKQVVELLNKTVKSNVEITNKIDEKLVGGFVVRMEDTVIDASIKRQINELKNNLEK